MKKLTLCAAILCTSCAATKAPIEVYTEWLEPCLKYADMPQIDDCNALASDWFWECALDYVEPQLERCADKHKALVTVIQKYNAQ